MIAAKYNPSDVESKWYDYWMKNDFFHSEPDEREPYTIVIPPPNVTGVLHMGHMLNNTIQDILIRRARMMGKNACWVPGTDHASIATEAKVVAKLAAEGIKKSDITREQFLEHAWDWTHKHGGIILEQLKKLGASCDWSRTCFTMDKQRSESVIKVFIDLYNKGLIYRGVRMVNWDPEAKTALSDEEVIHKEQQGKLYYIRYMIAPPSPPEGGDVSDLHNIYGYQTANLANYKLLKEFALNMRRFSTEAESALWNLLRRKNLDVRFRKQHIIGDFIVDFVCLKEKLIIEVDGGYHNEPDAAEYDKLRTQILNDQGYNVLRFSNEEVIANSNYVLENIKNALTKTSPPLGGLGGAVIIATTRPETILGDTAVCINPNDPKNAHLKGKKVIVPIANRVVPIIEDDYVDIEFGTGCLKITPAHDVNDYVLGEKYNLPVLDIFNDDGTLNHHGLHYEGKDRFEVRRLIVEELTEKGLIEKIEPYENKVGFSERTNVPIEPKLSMQWFLKMEDLAKPALEAVMKDTIQLIPHKFKNMYRHWMENIKDWCVSRQLWWGHRIPAWYIAPSNSPKGGEQSTSLGEVRGCNFVVAETEEEARKLIVAKHPSFGGAGGGLDLKQDEDCLDTWFSSWLWPISVFNGINEPDNKDICYYYPTNDLVTAPEIIFFWVARMIISGYEYRKEPCFHNVYFTGIVRDKLGRKMSKSLGNSPDPIELMDKYGADGVRMGMLLTSPAGNDLPFDEALCEQGRNFNNKIWNALRLVKGWEVDDIEQPNENFIAISWFQSILDLAINEVDDLFSKYRLSEALMVIYKLFWDEFSAWFLEIIKPEFGKPIDKQTFIETINCFEGLLKLLHPFMPFITEELYHSLDNQTDKGSIMFEQLVSGYSSMINKYDSLSNFSKLKEIVTNIRNIRTINNIPPKEPLILFVYGEIFDSESCGGVDKYYEKVIKKLANIKSIETRSEKLPSAISFHVGTTEYAIQLGNLINAEEEIAKMQTEIIYLKGFLKSVNSKLGNEKFVANAKPYIVEIERKKQADAESKIKSLTESITQLKSL